MPSKRWLSRNASCGSLLTRRRKAEYCSVRLLTLPSGNDGGGYHLRHRSWNISSMWRSSVSRGRVGWVCPFCGAGGVGVGVDFYSEIRAQLGNRAAESFEAEPRVGFGITDDDV